MSIELNTMSNPILPERVRRSPKEAARESISRPVALSSTEELLWQQLAETESLVLEKPTDPHITNYLDNVRDLLNQALKRHQAQSATYWSPKGKFRQMVHIVQVNRALDDLLNDLRSGRPAIEMARRLDSIRGLLLDLWM